MTYREKLDNLNIGDCFTVGEKKFKILERTNCDDCDLDLGCIALDFYGLRPECDKFLRHDKKDVFFKEVKDE